MPTPTIPQAQAPPSTMAQLPSATLNPQVHKRHGWRRRARKTSQPSPKTQICEQLEIVHTVPSIDVPISMSNSPVEPRTYVEAPSLSRSMSLPGPEQIDNAEDDTILASKSSSCFPLDRLLVQSTARPSAPSNYVRGMGKDATDKTHKPQYHAGSGSGPSRATTFSPHLFNYVDTQATSMYAHMYEEWNGTRFRWFNPYDSGMFTWSAMDTVFASTQMSDASLVSTFDKSASSSLGHESAEYDTDTRHSNASSGANVGTEVVTLNLESLVYTPLAAFPARLSDGASVSSVSPRSQTVPFRPGITERKFSYHKLPVTRFSGYKLPPRPRSAAGHLCWSHQRPPIDVGDSIEKERAVPINELPGSDRLLDETTFPSLLNSPDCTVGEGDETNSEGGHDGLKYGYPSGYEGADESLDSIIFIYPH
ncbi:hypothetical protein FISHEDRAFT_71554 [Fistulina hepatica ATCC 64428]|uniref:Uncharacterized protein n=1 Tax=Fistulina hepatica ATCC 64428 TaxID=1128425 RepID=A0A0D7AJK0_9AGAR|nr:hypothetical protein FISHEDRAFT_71554 [Fistulina hepatica ATCC 64428]